MTPWTVAHQTPLSVGFYRQEYWSGLPFPSSGGLFDPGIELTSPVAPELAGRFFATEPPGKPILLESGFPFNTEIDQRHINSVPVEQIYDQNVTMNSSKLYLFQQHLYTVKSFSLFNTKIMLGFPADFQTPVTSLSLLPTPLKVLSSTGFDLLLQTNQAALHCLNMPPIFLTSCSPYCTIYLKHPPVFFSI